MGQLLFKFLIESRYLGPKYASWDEIRRRLLMHFRAKNFFNVLWSACTRSFPFLRNFVQKTIFFMSYFSHENLHTNEVNLYKKKLKKKDKTVGKGGKSHITWTGMTKIAMYLLKNRRNKVIDFYSNSIVWGLLVM